MKKWKLAILLNIPVVVFAAWTSLMSAPHDGSGAWDASSKLNSTLNPTSGGGWTDDGTTVRLSTSTDSVGIGTSTPVTELDVWGTMTVSNNGHLVLPLTNDATTPTLGFGDGDTGIYQSADNQIDFTLSGAKQWFMSPTRMGKQSGNGPNLLNEAASTTNPTLVPEQGDGDTGIGGDGSDMVSIIAGGTEMMRLDDAGTINIINPGGADVDTQIKGLSEDNLVYIDAGNDRVGIGTSTPAVLLDVKVSGDKYPSLGGETGLIVSRKTASAISILTDTSGSSSLYFSDYNDEDVGLITYSHSSNRMTFRTAGTGTDLAIDIDGNIGVGTTTPLTLLDIEAGAITLQEMTAPGTPPANHVYLYVDSADGDLKAKDDNGEVVLIADFAVD